jgi:hypothetical protein
MAVKARNIVLSEHARPKARLRAHAALPFVKGFIFQ